MPVKHYKRQVNRKPTDIQQSHYSDKQKFEAVVTYMLLGNMAAVSETTGIPHDRLRHWKMAPWWKELEEQIRQQKRVEVSGKLSKIIDKAHKVVEDRLENGDWRMDRDGNLHRIGVTAKVAGDILHKSIDKQILIDKIQEAPEVKQEAVMDRLKSIEQRLIEASKIRKTLPQVIDVEPTHVE